MLRSVLDVVFPLRCAGCGAGSWPFCETCLLRLVALSGPGCRRCGRPFDREVERCRDCPPPGIGLARSAFLYSGPAKAALRRLKLSGWRAVASALAAAMVSVNVVDPQVVTWVPVSSRRRARRGYDQARALAVSVGERLGRPVERLLVRARDGPPQASRSAAERRTAVRGSFVPAPSLLSGRAPPATVLLVDDTLTTGATAGECAAVLRRAGVDEVGLLTAARAIPGRLPDRCYAGTGSSLGPWLPGDHPR